ncbi:MAG: dockerin type I domain-containing protein [Porcipelethomonas sp.]
MKLKSKILSVVTSCAVAVSAAAAMTAEPISFAAGTEDISNTYDWGTVEIGGGGFVSGIVTGQNEMYLRTDVGGAYKYNYDKGEWEQLFGFLNEADRGLLSVSGMAIDPTDDDTVYFLCGCAYFSGARTEIFKTTDGGKTFERYDVTDLIQVHANGDGRECSEPIAVDPDDPDTIYAGGDVASGSSALIKSTDGGKTWNPVTGYSDAVEYPYTIKWPFWTNHTVKAITTDGEQSYANQNGVATIKIFDGKVYVGTSVTGQTNIHVADVDKDVFTELSADLPTANYPVTISDDGNGNLFVTYIAGLAFSGSAGGAYKYNIATGTVTDISPNGNAIGMITADKSDPNKLLARTCGVWSDQWYEEEWTDGSIAWGDHFFRSEDGGATWTDITPGQGDTIYDENGSHKEFTSLPIDTNGYDWIYGKACHWGSGILIDPRNSDRILMTSGNGVFACDNTWADKGIQFYFAPQGIEEVVALDMVSVPGGSAYSAIGDYDGFEHTDVDVIGRQYVPNIGSTSVIAYCPQNPDVMVRFGENEAKGYYSTDKGVTWTEMANSGGQGGKGAIAQIDDDTYRIFHTSASGISYSDDFGGTWNNSSGTVGTKQFGVLVDLNDPSIVYAYTAKYNDYWGSDPNKTEPTLDDAQYDFMVSSDGGKTFTNNIVCKYDMCDVANRIAYLEEGTVALAAGWNGLYIGTKDGTTKKLDSVSYCKTVGYGAPEEEGGVNTLYMYGKPQDTDPEGIYRSSDAGETWVCINTQNLYGGTGNGNFLVGDMNEFGKVYMSTVGCGIVYGAASTDDPEPPVTTAATTSATTTSKTSVTSESATSTDVSTTEAPEVTTAEPTEPETNPSYTGEPDDLLYGDVDLDGKVSVSDVTKLYKYLASKDIYPLGKQTPETIAKAMEQADVAWDSNVDGIDGGKLIEYCLNKITQDQLGPQ